MQRQLGSFERNGKKFCEFSFNCRQHERRRMLPWERRRFFQRQKFGLLQTVVLSAGVQKNKLKKQKSRRFF